MMVKEYRKSVNGIRALPYIGAEFWVTDEECPDDNDPTWFHHATTETVHNTNGKKSTYRVRIYRRVIDCMYITTGAKWKYMTYMDGFTLTSAEAVKDIVAKYPEFIRTHRYAAIHKEHVHEMGFIQDDRTADVVMRDKKVIPISRREVVHVRGRIG